MSVRSRHPRFRDESGSMLVELLIAMTFLTIAVGALLSVFTSSALSLRHTSIEGNALTLVDQQMERFKTFPYAAMKLDATTIPSSSDPYVSSPPTSLTGAQQAGISSSQVTSGANAATQTITGPDGRVYRVDTYIFTGSPPQGRTVTQVTIAARLVTAGAAGSIRAQATSAFDAASTEIPPA